MPGQLIIFSNDNYTYFMMKTKQKYLLILAIIDVFIVIISIIGAKSGFEFLSIGKSTAFLSFGAASIGIITFLGTLIIFNNSNDNISERSLRTSITIALVTVYIFIVGVVAFFGEARELSEMKDVTKTMLTSFTSIIGVIIAFFFGTSAYIEAKSLKSKNSKEPDV